MYKYFKKIDKQINETLNIYQELGKISIPLFKYLLLIISFLVVTSCIAIILSFFNNDNDEIDNNSLWINYSLPIIIYGITCPIISTVISSIFKLFLEFQINNIKNKHKYIYKKNGKHTNFRLELYNICVFIFYSRTIILLPFFSLYLFLPINKFFCYILMSMSIVFCILFKLSQYYDNYIDCNIIGIEKCHSENEIYWRYCISIQYPNEEQRIIKKRFTDFKKLHNGLDTKDNLPTSNWFTKPFQLSDAEERGKQLNLYMKNIMEKKDTMSNSLFHSFFKDNNNDEKSLIMEKDFFQKSFIDDETIITLKIDLANIINDSIIDIFILYEINYYTVLKKRFFIFNNYFLYKLRYDKLRKQFNIRYKIPLHTIYKVEKSIIYNTYYLKNKEIIIIHYEEDNIIKQISLVSINTQLSYNINGLFSYLKSNLDKKCHYVISENYNYDTGYGISENIVHNDYIKNVKNILTDNLLYGMSYFS